mmetsp:Transcript_3113/g.9212  ORF Transcript_3113/g.9212 Transcript_3113/m.9212 type:complete len:221 (-) Transcript_3113:405-1067(-)
MVLQPHGPGEAAVRLAAVAGAGVLDPQGNEPAPALRGALGLACREVHGFLRVPARVVAMRTVTRAQSLVGLSRHGARPEVGAEVALAHHGVAGLHAPVLQVAVAVKVGEGAAGRRRAAELLALVERVEAVDVVGQRLALLLHYTVCGQVDHSRGHRCCANRQRLALLLHYYTVGGQVDHGRGHRCGAHRRGARDRRGHRGLDLLIHHRVVGGEVPSPKDF